VLDGESPRLIDEWQLEPAIWNHVRRAVDDREGTGLFILTGSSVPPDDDTRHSGAGRFIRLRMRPMTLSESGHSTGAISLRELLAGAPAKAADTGLTVHRIAEFVTVGGWPDNLRRTVEQAQRLVRGYVGEVARTDIQRVQAMHRAAAARRERPMGLRDGSRPEHTTAVALLDRLLHHATTVVTSGDSYRVKEARQRGGGIPITS